MGFGRCVRGATFGFAGALRLIAWPFYLADMHVHRRYVLPGVPLEKVMPLVTLAVELVKLIALS